MITCSCGISALHYLSFSVIYSKFFKLDYTKIFLHMDFLFSVGFFFCTSLPFLCIFPLLQITSFNSVYLSIMLFKSRALKDLCQGLRQTDRNQQFEPEEYNTQGEDGIAYSGKGDTKGPCYCCLQLLEGKIFKTMEQNYE